MEVTQMWWLFLHGLMLGGTVGMVVIAAILAGVMARIPR